MPYIKVDDITYGIRYVEKNPINPAHYAVHSGPMHFNVYVAKDNREGLKEGIRDFVKAICKNIK